MELILASRPEGRYHVLEVAGEVDAHTATQLRSRFLELLNAGHHDLVADLQGVTFLDSTGLGVLVGVLKRIRGAEGSLSLVCVEDRVLKIFRITGLDQVFTIHATLQSALDTDPVSAA